MSSSLGVACSHGNHFVPALPSGVGLLERTMVKKKDRCVHSA